MRINVEDSIDGDFRYKVFSSRIKDDYRALGMMIYAWRLAQKYWCPEKKLIPKEIWDLFEPSKEMISCHLAEERKNGIYVRGTEEQFAWYFQKIESGRLGGLKSVKSRWGKHRLSTAQAPLKHRLSTAQAEGKQRVSESNPPAPAPAPAHKKNIHLSTTICAASSTLIDFLNEKCGKSFKPQTWDKHIRKVMGWGFTVEDLKQVVENQLKDEYFLENPRYYRPQTLWQSREKIEAYLQKNTKKSSSEDFIEYMKAKGYE